MQKDGRYYRYRYRDRYIDVYGLVRVLLGLLSFRKGFLRSRHARVKGSSVLLLRSLLSIGSALGSMKL